MIQGKTVTVKYTKRDRYRRIIGTIYFRSQVSPLSPSEQSVNALLVASGYAWWYRKYSKDKTLGEMETQAQKNQIGLWEENDAVAPWRFRKR